MRRPTISTVFLLHLFQGIALTLVMGGCDGTPEGSCSDPASAPDASCEDMPDSGLGGDAAADVSVERCGSDTHCSDGLFCNGAERCDPASGSPSGCVAGSPPCTADGLTCSEEESDCVSDCGTRDADGDGHDSVGCGGDDCDDTDSRVYAGNVEVCDLAGLDEDCVPDTIGDDADGDGYVYVGCCHLAAGAADPTCGRDCDDGNPEVSPDASDVCNGVDDDCDGVVDEGVTRTCWHDGDGDGHAAADAMTSRTCGDCPSGTTPNEPRAGMVDCDDGDAARYPSAPELCDRVDSDCSTSTGVEIDEDFDDDGHAPPGAPCAGGPLPRDDCDDSRADRHPGATELCDRFDSDCSSSTSAEPSEDFDEDGHAPLSALCEGGYPMDDCDDADARVHGGQTSYFTEERASGGFDYDCDTLSTRQYQAVGECTQESFCVGLEGCMVAEGFNRYAGAAPACGRPGSWVHDCTCEMKSGACFEITESRVQPCR